MPVHNCCLPLTLSPVSSFVSVMSLLSLSIHVTLPPSASVFPIYICLCTLLPCFFCFCLTFPLFLTQGWHYSIFLSLFHILALILEIIIHHVSSALSANTHTEQIQLHTHTLTHTHTHTPYSQLDGQCVADFEITCNRENLALVISPRKSSQKCNLLLNHHHHHHM